MNIFSDIETIVDNIDEFGGWMKAILELKEFSQLRKELKLHRNTLGNIRLFSIDISVKVESA